MNNPSFTQTQKQDRPILIVDKNGLIGPDLADKLSQNFIVVLVASRPSKTHENIIHVPFIKKIPTVPDNYYSYIFLIDDGHVLLNSMSSFLKKAVSDQSRIVLIEGIRSYSRKSIEEVKLYKNSNVYFYGDLFSNDKYLSGVSDFLTQIKLNRQIEIEGEGLEEVYPIHIDDFLDSLVEQVFIKNNSAKIINVFPKNPITKIGLARLLSSIDPLIKTDFKKNKKKLLNAKIENGEFVLGDKVDIRTRFKKILEEEVSDDFQKKDSLSDDTENTNFLRSAVVFIFLFILFFISLPLITTVFYSALGLYEIDSLKINLEKGDIDAAYKSANNSNTYFNLAAKTLIPLKTEASIIGKGNIVDSYSQKIYLGQSISETSKNLISSSQKIQSIITGKSNSPQTDFNNAMSLMKNAIAQFRRIEAQSSDYPELSRKISDVKPVVDLVSNSTNIFPDALGFNSQRTYLVLFQNNMELRPGGGFIGSYGILKIKNATVNEFKIYNVYDADGQLKGHIEPPFPIRKYLPQPNLFLRDSNFDLNFTNNASTAAMLLNLETGQKIDGVIGVDLSFLKEILSTLGPISVTDYNIEVNSSNLFKIIEEKSQNDSFPGSTQKQDFLSSLFKEIQVKIGETKTIPYISFAKIISNSLLQKHILLASNQASLQSQLLVNNWSSQIPVDSVSEANIFNDFLGVNEANLGINKVNYHISRSISKAQKIDDQGNLSSTVSVSYANNSKRETYKNYIRFILPSSISVSQISLDNIAQDIISAERNAATYESKNYRAPLGLQVDTYLENGKTVVGFLIVVSPDSHKTISLTYSLNQILKLDLDFKYKLNIFKQPGVEAFPLELSIYYPSKFNLVTKSNGVKDSGDKITLRKDVDSDTSFNFSFGQK